MERSRESSSRAICANGSKSPGVAVRDYDHSVAKGLVRSGEIMNRSIIRVQSLRWFVALFSVACTMGLLTSSLKAQTSVTDGRTPSGMAPGAPAGSYALSGLDDINLFNGNLNFNIPLITIGGRGSAGYTMTFRPNQNRFKWRVVHNIQKSCNQTGCTFFWTVNSKTVE